MCGCSRLAARRANVSDFLAVCADDWKVWLLLVGIFVFGYFVGKEGGDWND